MSGAEEVRIQIIASICEGVICPIFFILSPDMSEYTTAKQSSWLRAALQPYDWKIIVDAIDKAMLKFEKLSCNGERYFQPFMQSIE